MKKFFIVIAVIALILSISLAANFKSLSTGKTAADFGAKTVLIVHYHRYDNKYAGWNLWI